MSLQQYAGRKPASLSGGQQQRLVLTRCLVRNRSLLLDAPFTGLDDALRTETLALIADLQKSRNLTLLITTRRLQEAQALGRRFSG